MKDETKYIISLYGISLLFFLGCGFFSGFPFWVMQWLGWSFIAIAVVFQVIQGCARREKITLELNRIETQLDRLILDSMCSPHTVVKMKVDRLVEEKHRLLVLCPNGIAMVDGKWKQRYDWHTYTIGTYDECIRDSMLSGTSETKIIKDEDFCRYENKKEYK